MGASNAGAGGSDDGFQQEPTRSTLSSKNQAKADKKSRERFTEYTKENLNPNNNKQKKATITYDDDGGQGAGAESGNNTITQVTKTAPTESEVSQSTTTEADADTEANRLLKIKKRGRKMTMMSGAKGVTRTSSDYSLGKKSLLGIV